MLKILGIGIRKERRFRFSFPYSHYLQGLMEVLGGSDGFCPT